MALWSCIRFSLRILGKHWKLTAIAVFSLAIAMAGGAVGFSIFNTLLLRPPAVPAPEQLASVYTTMPTEEFSGTNYDDYNYYRDNNHVFSDVLAFPYSVAVRPISYDGRTRSGLMNAVSDNYFSVPRHGRGSRRTRWNPSATLEAAPSAQASLRTPPRK